MSRNITNPTGIPHPRYAKFRTRDLMFEGLKFPFLDEDGQYVVQTTQGSLSFRTRKAAEEFFFE